MKPVTQNAQFRTVDEARLSTKQKTRSEAIEYTETAIMDGWHIDNSKELAVLKNTNQAVLDLLKKGWIITGETGETEQLQEGPSDILENGERMPLYDKPWSALSKYEQDHVLYETNFLNSIFSIKSEKAWEVPGSNPSNPVRVTLKGFGGYFHVSTAGATTIGEIFGEVRGWVVWTRNAATDARLLRNTEEEPEPKTVWKRLRVDSDTTLYF